MATQSDHARDQFDAHRRADVPQVEEVAPMPLAAPHAHAHRWRVLQHLPESALVAEHDEMVLGVRRRQLLGPVVAVEAACKVRLPHEDCLLQLILPRARLLLVQAPGNHRGYIRVETSGVNHLDELLQVAADCVWCHGC
eukprot:6301452-Prymnesium_polylepis.1